MKRLLLCLALTCVLTTLLLSQLNCAAPTGSDNTKTTADAPANANKDDNANSTDALRSAAAVEAELMKMERDWANTVKTRDVETVKRIEAEDIVLTYPDGSVGDRAQDIKDIESGALTADAWDLSDMKVRVYDADAAVVTGRSTIKNGKYRQPDGKVRDISGEYRFTDTFIKRNGRWQVVATQSTKIERP